MELQSLILSVDILNIGVAAIRLRLVEFGLPLCQKYFSWLNNGFAYSCCGSTHCYWSLHLAADTLFSRSPLEPGDERRDYDRTGGLSTHINVSGFSSSTVNFPCHYEE